jgi:hypothetical protein
MCSRQFESTEKSHVYQEAVHVADQQLKMSEPGEGILQKSSRPEHEAVKSMKA